MNSKCPKSSEIRCQTHLANIAQIWHMLTSISGKMWCFALSIAWENKTGGPSTVSNQGTDPTWYRRWSHKGPGQKKLLGCVEALVFYHFSFQTLFKKTPWQHNLFSCLEWGSWLKYRELEEGQHSSHSFFRHFWAENDESVQSLAVMNIWLFLASYVSYGCWAKNGMGREIKRSQIGVTCLCFFVKHVATCQRTRWKHNGFPNFCYVLTLSWCSLYSGWFNLLNGSTIDTPRPPKNFRLHLT